VLGTAFAIIVSLM